MATSLPISIGAGHQKGIFMYRDIVERIEKIQRSRINEIHIRSDNGDTKIDGPSKKCSGMYFFYTSYTMEELRNGSRAATNSAVPIDDLARKYGSLDKIHRPDSDGFHLVYNGIGGYKGKGYDLRSRILQEISCTHDKTGSLCIRQTKDLNDVSRWRFSYVSMANSKEDMSAADIVLPWNFAEHGTDIEKAWRFHYGWPLLCRY
ncbi:MAG TPA: hypothetical protein VJ577_08675 [Burkholderiaceae bacterium]|nr:hypothetical protein [Burkholderiaceae bacterium]